MKLNEWNLAAWRLCLGLALQGIARWRASEAIAFGEAVEALQRLHCAVNESWSQIPLEAAQEILRDAAKQLRPYVEPERLGEYDNLRRIAETPEREPPGGWNAQGVRAFQEALLKGR